MTRGTGTYKNRDEVKRRDVYECDGSVCDLDVKGVSSIFKRIRSVESLTRIFSIFDLSCEEKDEWRQWNWFGDVVQDQLLKLEKSGQFPDEIVKIEDTQILCVTSHTY